MEHVWARLEHPVLERLGALRTHAAALLRFELAGAELPAPSQPGAAAARANQPRRRAPGGTSSHRRAGSAPPAPPVRLSARIARRATADRALAPGAVPPLTERAGLRRRLRGEAPLRRAPAGRRVPDTVVHALSSPVALAAPSTTTLGGAVGRAPHSPPTLRRAARRTVEPESAPQGHSVTRLATRLTRLIHRVSAATPATEVRGSARASDPGQSGAPAHRVPREPAVDLEALRHEVLGEVLRELETQSTRGEDPDEHDPWF